MAEDRLTRPGAPPARTLLHRGLPAPLPRWPTRAASFAIWFPLVVFLMFVLPVTFGVMLDVLHGDLGLRPLGTALYAAAMLAGVSTVGYELVAVLRHRRRRG